MSDTYSFNLFGVAGNDSLSPCPFCGAKADRLTLVSGRSRSFVMCDVCHAFGPISMVSDVACTLWNKAADRDIDEPIDIYCDIVGHLERKYLGIDDDPFGDPDVHSCRDYANESGYCQVCGSIVHGSLADYEEHGYDPPEARR